MDLYMLLVYTSGMFVLLPGCMNGQPVTSCTGFPCQNGATCEDTETGYRCFCVEGYIGQTCESDFDECESYPCLNDGTCEDLVDGFKCACLPPFRGDNCAILPCDTAPCENEALCEDDVTFNRSLTGYTCECILGFSGLRCEINLEDCDTENDTSCSGNGLCVDGINDYSCLCEPGWIGEFCQQPVDDCIGNPCRNGGACVDQHLGFRCLCLAGFNGDLCERERDECTTWSPCQNEANCVDMFNGYRCECTSAWMGENCTVEADECLTNRCENGGQCLDIVGGYTCRCRPFFTGALCETAYNPCAPEYNPCQNGANCVAPPDGKYICFCTAGFTGVNCEVNINECLLSPCKNNARCEDITAGYVCHCRTGWTGMQCETNIDDCASQPCSNDAMCFDVLNGFHCNCTSNYTGRLCEEPIDFCMQTPCYNEGTCLSLIGDYQCECLPPYTGRNCLDLLDDCDSSPCLNNATCLNTDNGFECVCEAPFTGQRCDVITNHCASQPCLNGGSCRQVRDSWVCICPIYLTGRRCTDLIDYCEDAPCQNGGICINNVFGLRCMCLYGYTGRLCEEQVDLCADKPCLNSGNCSNIPGGFVCSCTNDYTGDVCESVVTSASSVLSSFTHISPATLRTPFKSQFQSHQSLEFTSGLSSSNGALTETKLSALNKQTVSASRDTHSLDASTVSTINPMVPGVSDLSMISMDLSISSTIHIFSNGLSPSFSVYLTSIPESFTNQISRPANTDLMSSSKSSPVPSFSNSPTSLTYIQSTITSITDLTVIESLTDGPYKTDSPSLLTEIVMSDLRSEFTYLSSTESILPSSTQVESSVGRHSLSDNSIQITHLYTLLSSDPTVLSPSSPDYLSLSHAIQTTPSFVYASVTKPSQSVSFQVRSTFSDLDIHIPFTSIALPPKTVSSHLSPTPQFNSSVRHLSTFTRTTSLYEVTSFGSETLSQIPTSIIYDPQRLTPVYTSESYHYSIPTDVQETLSFPNSKVTGLSDVTISRTFQTHSVHSLSYIVSTKTSNHDFSTGMLCMYSPPVSKSVYVDSILHSRDVHSATGSEIVLSMFSDASISWSYTKAALPLYSTKQLNSLMSNEISSYTKYLVSTPSTMSFMGDMTFPSSTLASTSVILSEVLTFSNISVDPSPRVETSKYSAFSTSLETTLAFQTTFAEPFSKHPSITLSGVSISETPITDLITQSSFSDRLLTQLPSISFHSIFFSLSSNLYNQSLSYLSYPHKTIKTSLSSTFYQSTYSLTSSSLQSSFINPSFSENVISTFDELKTPTTSSETRILSRSTLSTASSPKSYVLNKSLNSNTFSSLMDHTHIQTVTSVIIDDGISPSLSPLFLTSLRPSLLASHPVLSSEPSSSLKPSPASLMSSSLALYSLSASLSLSQSLQSQTSVPPTSSSVFLSLFTSSSTSLSTVLALSPTKSFASPSLAQPSLITTSPSSSSSSTKIHTIKVSNTLTTEVSQESSSIDGLSTPTLIVEPSYVVSHLSPYVTSDITYVKSAEFNSLTSTQAIVSTGLVSFATLSNTVSSKSTHTMKVVQSSIDSTSWSLQGSIYHTAISSEFKSMTLTPTSSSEYSATPEYSMTDDVTTPSTASFTSTSTSGPAPPQACDSFQCLNGGVCRLDIFGPYCDCPEGFVGLICEKETDVCKGFVCENGGICSVVTTRFNQKVPTCRCTLPYTGTTCDRELLIFYPSFQGQSYLLFETYGLSSTTTNEIVLSIKTTQLNGTILFSRSDQSTETTTSTSPSFVHLFIEEGKLQYRYSCDGVIVADIRTSSVVNTGDVYDVIIRQMWPSMTGDWCSASLTVNMTPFVSSPVIANGVPHNLGRFIIGGILRHNHEEEARVSTDVINGFVGCARNLQINGVEIDMIPMAIHGLNVENCNVPVCQHDPCKNGATCHSTGDDWYCACLTGYGGDLCETKLCETSPCFHGGTCVVLEMEKDTLCVCPYGRGGSLCEQELKPTMPHFSGNRYGLTSYLAFNDVHFMTDNFQMEFNLVIDGNSTNNNLIIYMGNTNGDGGRSDFFVLGMVRGYMLFRFDLGSGSGDIYSPEPVDVTLPYHVIKLGRDGRTGWLQVDHQDNTTGQSYGPLTALNVRSDLYIGGMDTVDNSLVAPMAKFEDGLKGCIYNLRIKSFHSKFTEPGNPPGHVDKGRNVRECSSMSCDPNPCQNEAECVDIGASIFCNCTKGWRGLFCMDRITICDGDHACASGSTCLPTPSGGYRCLCPLGRRGDNCTQDITISDAMFVGEDSYMAFQPVYVKKRIDIQLSIKPVQSSGLLFYVAQRLHSYSGDFLSVGLSNWNVELRFSLGSNLNVVRSETKLPGQNGDWFSVTVGRNSTHGYVSVDGNATVSLITGSMLYLDTTTYFYLGGMPSLTDASPLAFQDEPMAYEGCIREFIVNNRTYDLTVQGAITGRDIEDCDATVCGHSVCKNGGQCHVTQDGDFNCTCPDSFYGDTCNLSVECMTHRCFHGNCVPGRPYTCNCHLGWTGEFCDKETELGTTVSFQQSSHVVYSQSSDSLIDALQNGARSSVISGVQDNANVTQMSLMFKSTSLHGLILWNGQTYTDDEDYLGIGLFEGRVKVVWNLGWYSRTETITSSRYADGEWHSLTLDRQGQQMTFTVDGATYDSRVSGDFYLLDTGPIYHLGGFKDGDVTHQTFENFRAPYVGCLREISINRQTVTFEKGMDGINIDLCEPG